MDHYADDLAALTAHLNLKEAVHVGHSTGGGEVVRYLARHGESRVAKAAIISAVPPDRALPRFCTAVGKVAEEQYVENLQGLSARHAYDGSRDDQRRPAGVPERSSEHSGGAMARLVDLAVFCELREVVDETRMNHAIGHRCSAAQAFEVFKIAPVHLGASCGK
jgi:pimeloyl-ACP methyl ester carboxylesterase